MSIYKSLLIDGAREELLRSLSVPRLSSEVSIGRTVLQSAVCDGAVSIDDDASERDSFVRLTLLGRAELAAVLEGT